MEKEMQLHGKKIWTFLAIFLMIATLLSSYGTALAAPKTSSVPTFALHQSNPATTSIGVEKTAQVPYKCEFPTRPTNLDELTFRNKLVQSETIEPNRLNQTINKQKTIGLTKPNWVWETSYNWAGVYRGVYHPDEPQKFQKVSAVWRVPSIPATTFPSEVSTWVGLGGYADDPHRPGYKEVLYQAGTDSFSYLNDTGYEFWFEIYRGDKNSPMVRVKEVPINPGDQVYVQVWINPDYDPKSNRAQVNFYLDNVTQKKDCNIHIEDQDLLSRDTPSTAEWIVERPTVGLLGAGYIPSLANFGTISFTQARYSALWDGKQDLLPVSDDHNYNSRIDMWNRDNIFLALTDEVKSDGEIIVYWRNPK